MHSRTLLHGINNKKLMVRKPVKLATCLGFDEQLCRQCRRKSTEVEHNKTILVESLTSHGAGRKACMHYIKK